MAGPNDKHRQGGHRPPPSVIASAPAAASEVEPARSVPVAAASPAPVIAEPAQADVEPTGAEKLAQVLAAEPGDLVLPTVGAHGAAHVAASTFAFVEDAPPAAPRSYVAVCPIFVGGQRGRIEPGEAFKPATDAERDMLLAQRVIRAS